MALQLWISFQTIKNVSKVAGESVLWSLITRAYVQFRLSLELLF